ncbi:MAG: hypothetical protein PHH85_02220 [Candidatus Methanoperedens sp.]|nr:hypothetical protein [Candidatus Methanoperedens sp.]
MRGRMCKPLKEQRKARQRQKYNARRRLRTHKGRTGHRFVMNRAYHRCNRVCAVCGQGY